MDSVVVAVYVAWTRRCGGIRVVEKRCSAADMAWWKSIGGHSSSSKARIPTRPHRASSTPPSPPRLDSGIVWRRRGAQQQKRRLTRQRKLRHLSELDVLALGLNVAVSAPVTRSVSGLDSSAAIRSSPASASLLTPQPLPRPVESATTGRVEGEEADGACGPSSSLVEPVGERSPVATPTPNTVGRLACHIIQKGDKRVDVASAGINSTHRRQAHQDQSTNESVDFRIHVSSPEGMFASPDRPPLCRSSVRSPKVKSKDLDAFPSPLLPKYPESSTAWHNRNGTISVHPLPLPPGSVVPVRWCFSDQFFSKNELVCMTNQWQKGKLIGSGNFGRVYIARNRHTGALCAMKEVDLILDDPKSAESIRQLDQEIKVLSQLKHPNIVQYYGSEMIDDRLYIYMEYIYPGSIDKYVRKHFRAITESVVRNFTRHILKGLAYLHSKKTMHRDIKGANLLVDAFGVVKLGDFGMAKHMSGTTAVLSLKGTPYWMAPEVVQAMMKKDVGYDFAVDIWSLGCTIIEMFTGKHPWSGFEGPQAMFQVLHKSPHIPETLSAEGKDFLQCCFHRNPADRPTASQLLEHPFISNSHCNGVRGTAHSFARLKLAETTYSPREGDKSKMDSPVKERELKWRERASTCANI